MSMNLKKEGQKLPLFGIGPLLVWGIGLLTLVGIILTYSILRTGTVRGNGAVVLRTLGVILIIAGFVIWYIGALRSGMDESITENKLNTSGIYAWVRNPMYSGWWFMITGISLEWHNLWLLILIPVNWLILTVTLISTEEKWLLDVYGEPYAQYKKNVNRLIPWKRRGNSGV